MVKHTRVVALHEVVVVLMAFQLILSQTIFNGTQQIVEVLLAGIISYLIIKNGVSSKNIIFISIFLLTQVLSLTLNNIPLQSFLLNIKEIGLAIITIVYFKNYATPSRVIYILFYICLFLVFIQYFITTSFPIEWVGSIVKNIGLYTKERPLGLFLDFHTSAYFLAVCFIGISLKRNLFFIDIII